MRLHCVRALRGVACGAESDLSHARTLELITSLRALCDAATADTHRDREAWTRALYRALELELPAMRAARALERIAAATEVLAHTAQDIARDG